MAVPFRLGLVGAGRMGRTHMRALEGADHVTISAIAEPVAQSREAVAAAGVPVYASVAELLDSAAIDGVLVVVPTTLHAEVIAEVAAAGLPIMCEKPCGLNSADARASAQVAQQAGVPLQVAYWRRYVPALQQLRARILAGDLGSLHLVCCFQWDEEPPSPAFLTSSGGIFTDMGVHEFDQIRWLTGQEIGLMSGAAASVSDTIAPAGDADSAQVIAQLSGGSVGLISLGRYYPGGDMARAEVFGSGGYARCDFLDPADGERAQLDALRRQAEDFAAMAGGAAGSGATAADAVAALTAAEQASTVVQSLAGRL
jgi:myo-inositol 2-dehydrogenase / D-chiro-inositol 1-dehydrogenase